VREQQRERRSRTGLRFRPSFLLFAALFSQAGCVLFTDTSEPPEVEELSPSRMAAEGADDAWYNTSMLRSWFGDFKQTDPVYITDPESAGALIARGRYLADGAAACGVCHGSKPEDPASPLSGGRPMKDSFGLVHAANITPAKTGIAGWNVFEVMRAIRSSIDRAGRPFSIDLHLPYRWMSDQDAKALSLYLLASKPVENEVERRRLGGFQRNRWGIVPQHSEVAGYVTALQEDASVGYGRYLTNSVSGCAQCHTAGGIGSGNKLLGGFYQSGGFSGLFDEILSLFESTPLDEEEANALLVTREAVKEKAQALPGEEIQKIYAEAIAEGNFPVGGPNIRGTSEAGLKTWSESDIVHYLSNGTTPDGEIREKRFCPWNRFAKMSETSKLAIAKYLKSL